MKNLLPILPLGVHSWCSLGAGRMQDEAMAPSWAGGTGASVLAAAPVLRAAFCCGAQQPQVQLQPRKAAKGPLLSQLARVLRGLLELGNVRVVEEGKGRDHVDSLTW